MSKKTSESTRQSKAFKAWYDSKGATYNEARRQKYHTDKERREKARLQAAEYRQSVKETGKLPELRRGLYTISHLAAVLRISMQTVRNWEAKGMIPKTNQPGKHRLYTPEQVRLLLQLLKLPLKTEDDQIKFDHFHTLVFQRWDE
jgi:DNA-binding transcriptional regulator YiaG